jgi:hypothetical protein
VGEKLSDFRADDAVAHHTTEGLSSVCRHLLAEIGDRVPQLTAGLFFDLFRLHAKALAKEGRGPVGRANFPDEATSNDRNIEIIDEHALVGLGRHVAAIQFLTEEVVEGPSDFGMNLAANRVAIDRETTVVHRPDQRVPGRKPHIDLRLVGGLEAETSDLDDHHVVAVLCLHDVLCNVPEVGNMLRDGGLARVDGAVPHGAKNVFRDRQGRPR